MPNLNFVASVLDAETGLYVSGFEYNGEGTIRFDTTAPSVDIGLSMANAEAMRRNLAQSAIVSATTITLGGTAYGGGGTNAVAATGVLTASGLPSADQTVTIGTAGAEKVYTWKNSVSTTANQVLIDQGARATATLTFAGTGGHGETFTVNDKTYTLQSVLVDAADNILIGANQTATCNNIVSAIMGTAGAGTTYGTGTAAPTGVNSAVRSGTTVVFTATSVGTAANSYATTETCANASFGGATMSGGAAQSVQTTLANLKNAINAGTGSGTAYGSATTAHTKVTAASGATTLTVTAIIPGAAANAEATTETSSNMSWGAVTLEGGTDASA